MFFVVFTGYDILNIAMTCSERAQKVHDVTKPNSAAFSGNRRAEVSLRKRRQEVS